MAYRTWFNVVRLSDGVEVFSEQVIGNNAELSDASWKLLNICLEKGDIMDENGCYKTEVNPKDLIKALANHYHELAIKCFGTKHDTAQGQQTYSTILRNELKDIKSQFYRIPSWHVIGSYPAMFGIITAMTSVFPQQEYYYTLSAG